MSALLAVRDGRAFWGLRSSLATLHIGGHPSYMKACLRQKNHLNDGMDESTPEEPMGPGTLCASEFVRPHFKDLARKEELVWLIPSVVPSTEYNSLGMLLEGYRQTHSSGFCKITPLSESFLLSEKSRLIKLVCSVLALSV